MAVFIPVAVLASGFLADAVSAAPIADQSYINGLSELDDEKKAIWGAIASVFSSLAGGVGSVLGATGQKRDVAFENMSDEEKIASFWKFIPDIAGAIGGALGLGAGAYQHHQNGKQKRVVALEDMNDEEKKAFWGALVNVFGSLAGGVGSVLGATGQKRDVAFENMSDEEKIASFWKFIPDIAGAIGGALGLGAGAYQHHQNGKPKRAVSFEDMDDEEKKAIWGAIANVLKKPGVAGGILGTFGALAGGVGSVLGATGQKRDVAFENMSDEEKIASFWKFIPDIAGAIGGALGLGAGAYQHHQNGKPKRAVSFEDMDDEEKKAIWGAIANVLKKPGVAGGILGTFGALAGGVGSVLGATGQKRDVAFENMSDEEKIASFWKFIPDIAGAIGGALGLGAGAYQHHQNGKPKRAVDELTPLLGEEDKEAFWQLIPAIAGAVGGAMGLGAGVHQHIQNGKPKRDVYSQEFSMERRDLEDMALLARMIEDSELY